MKEKSGMNIASRFLEAQSTFENSYDKVLSDIKEERQISGRINHLFPRLKDSYATDTGYYLNDVEEAEELLSDPVLRNRLVELSEAILELDKNSFELIFGRRARRNIERSLTLFYEAEKIKPFKDILIKFFDEVDWDYVREIHRTRVIDDWQKFIPNTIEDDYVRCFLKEYAESTDVAVCFPTEEEKKWMFEAFNEGDTDAKNKIVNALLPTAIDVAVDYLGEFGLFLDNVECGLQAMMETIDKYRSDPLELMKICVREKAKERIEEIRSSANIRISDYEVKVAKFRYLLDVMSDEDNRVQWLTILSDKTGIDEEKVDALLKLLHI